ncbi:MAG: Flp pilus assembly protein CpaB [Deltaproteobacteria bacterium]|nr:Flp pilus assembly protein CpaB [Deltaproteobacteria bacterium]
MKKLWIAALITGILAALSNYLYASNLYKETTGGKKIKVAVTVSGVKKGEELKAENIGLKEIPVAYVDKRFITEDKIGEITDLPVAITVSAGETISWTDFSQRDDMEKNDLANFIEPGKRAITIPVNSSLSMGGLLKPGHRVDIIGTFNGDSGSNEKNRSVTLLQNITVLATGDKLDNSNKENNFSTVTLDITVEQGELLSYATQRGSLSVILRGYQDLTVTKDIPGVGEEELFTEQKLNEIQHPIKKSKKIERLIESN